MIRMAKFSQAWARLRDYNNDGWPDIFVNALANQNMHSFRNDKGTFETQAIRRRRESHAALRLGQR